MKQNRALSKTLIVDDYSVMIFFFFVQPFSKQNILSIVQLVCSQNNIQLSATPSSSGSSPASSIPSTPSLQTFTLTPGLTSQSLASRRNSNGGGFNGNGSANGNSGTSLISSSTGSLAHAKIGSKDFNTQSSIILSSTLSNTSSALGMGGSLADYDPTIPSSTGSASISSFSSSSALFSPTLPSTTVNTSFTRGISSGLLTSPLAEDGSSPPDTNILINTE